MENQSFLLMEPVGKLLRRYSLPCVLSLLVAALYNIVDQIFIANAPYLGSAGNAANTAVFPLTVLALAFAVWFGDGACASCSLFLGKKDPKLASLTLGNTICLLAGVSVVMCAAFLLFQNPLLTLFGASVNEQTFTFARQYFSWILVGIPFYILGQGLNPVIRADGSPKFAMGCTMAGAIVNLILDPLFIYSFHMGMAGAAISTILGQILTFALSVWYLFHLKTMKIEWNVSARVISSILSLGMTSFLAQISMVLSMAAVQNRLIHYSLLDPVFSDPSLAQIPLAVLGIVMKFFQIIISIAIGLAAGLIPVVSYNTGARQSRRILSFFRWLLALEFVLGLIGFVCVECFPQAILGLFGSGMEDPVYLNFGIRCFRIYLFMLPLATVNKGCFIFLQALGKGLESASLSFFREIIGGIGLPVLMPLVWGMDGVLYSFPAADLLTGVLSILAILHVAHSLKKAVRASSGNCVGQGLDSSLAAQGAK